MKLGLIILAVVAAVAYASAESSEPAKSPIPVADLVLSRQEPSETLVRNKRFTCDLLSFGAKGLSGWNHAACAAKCTAQRHRGGHCSGAECKCGKKW